MATKTLPRVTVRLKDEDEKYVEALCAHYGEGIATIFRLGLRALAAKEKLKVAVNPVRS